MNESRPGPGYPRLDAGFFVQFGINRGAAQRYANGWNNAVATVNTPVDPNSPAEKQIRQLYELGEAWGRISYLQGAKLVSPEGRLLLPKGEELKSQLAQKGDALVLAISRHLASDSSAAYLREQFTAADDSLRWNSRLPLATTQPLRTYREISDAEYSGARDFLGNAVKATIETMASTDGTVVVSTDPLKNLENIRKHQEQNPEKFDCPRS